MIHDYVLLFDSSSEYLFYFHFYPLPYTLWSTLDDACSEKVLLFYYLLFYFPFSHSKTCHKRILVDMPQVASHPLQRL